MMFTVTDLSKSYGPATVLNSVTFSLNDGMRAGLVGTNGVGKSTLLKILAGIEKADSGRIEYTSSISAGYLPQNLIIPEGQTIDNLLLQAAGELSQLEAHLHEMEESLSVAAGDELTQLMQEYGEAVDRFQQHGGYDISYRLDSIMAGLGIDYLDRSRQVNTLSGGEKTRVSLAALLLRSPDTLLLDEPTNNLDLKSLEWIENYLSHYRGGMIVASHDRQFLNNIVNLVFEIDEHSHQLKKYSGNYDAYKAVREAERAAWEEDYRNQQEEISELNRVMKMTAYSKGHASRLRDNDKFIPHFKGQRSQGADSRAIRSAEERLKRITDNPIPKPPKPLRFKATFQDRNLKSAGVIRVAGLNKSFGSQHILCDLAFTVHYKSRIVITGPNGAGKTTLLRLLAGRDNTDSGEIAFAPDVRIGVLSQEPEDIDSKMTVLEYYSHGLVGYEEDFVFGLVTCGLFRHEELKKSVCQLSLGQVRKLQIARIIAAEPNVLILDEPTNHISLDVLESFEAAIADFQGPILAVSHDRRFIQKFGGEVWELNEGCIVRSF